MATRVAETCSRCTVLFVINFHGFVHLLVLATISNCSVHGYGSLNIRIVSFVVRNKAQRMNIS